MSFDQFKAKPMQRFTSALWNSLMDELNKLDSRVGEALKKEDLQSIACNLSPDQSNARDLGSGDKQWRSVYAVDGHFSGNLYVQGKQVIKDGDPVGIGDISDTARDKITQAINNASVTQSIQEILSRLDAQLSSRASENTLAGVLARLDVDLSTRASEQTLQSVAQTLNDHLPQMARESTLQSILSKLDVDLSTRASESTLSSILTLLTSLLTSSGNVRVALVETTIKQPIDIQDHLSESITLVPSGTRTASGSGSDVDVARFAFGDFCVDVTAVSGTSPTLSVYIEGRIRAVGKYRVLCSFENISSVTTLCCTVNPLSYAMVRARWVIGGTSPSFTFSVVGELKS